eukprot:TRINITY_DN20798_c0_g1_i1.p1 TRINITY_DN20798_c0_g1~~TRINITY_DN20798_c0_g1_i1.p1  ORF type:complete len:349 (+),score=106.02 TRINITY_DN20798_c0_g1_i1:65-1048(+)
MTSTVVKDKAVAELTLDELPLDSLVARQTQSVVYGMTIEGKLWALKGVRMGDEADRVQFEREELALRQLNHPGIPSFARSYTGPDRRWILMQYAQGCTLEKLFYCTACLPEDLTLHIVSQVVEIVAHVHSSGWIYRDLKANNVVLSKRGAVRLVDFGLSRPLQAGERCGTPAGVRHVRAPEVVRKEQYGLAADWWSLGVLVWELLAGRPPFGLFDDDGDDGGIERKILAGIEGLPPPKASGPVLALIKELLHPDPAERLSDASAIRAHPAFSGIDWAAYADPERWPWRDRADVPNCVEPFYEEIEEQCIGFDQEAAPPTSWQAGWQP